LAKQVGGDIIENKTYLYLKAVAFSNQESGGIKAFIPIQPEDSTDKIERESSFNSSGASKATQDAIQDFTFKAFQMLDQMNIVTIKKLCLRHLRI
jgi:geranylgeranyl diphosphate synthase type II